MKGYLWLKRYIREMSGLMSKIWDYLFFPKTETNIGDQKINSKILELLLWHIFKVVSELIFVEEILVHILRIVLELD